MIGIVDIKMGNLRSVASAVYSLGFDPVELTEPSALDDVDSLILPGVGSFAAASKRLSESGFLSAIGEFSATGRPLLGICLGMQLLADVGEEGGGLPGLGIIGGRVERMAPVPPLRLPHVGWNTVTAVKEHPVLADIKPDRDFYFVHTFAHRPVNPDDVLATTEYGGEFVSAVACRNVVGVQFHPEKSQVNGMRLLENFLRWDGRC